MEESIKQIGQPDTGFVPPRRDSCILRPVSA